MTADSPATVAANRRMLLLLAAVFLLPVAVAFLMYYGGGWRPAGRTNHGELIEPALPLPPLLLARAGEQGAPLDPLRGKWSLVYVGAGSCDADCRRGLLLMRQTRLSLNQEMDRVARVLLSTGDCCDAAFFEREHAGLLVLDASPAAAQSLLASFPSQGRSQTLFVVDPLGNLVMRYDTRAQPRGLLEDLKKLLKLSHIG